MTSAPQPPTPSGSTEELEQELLLCITASNGIDLRDPELLRQASRALAEQRREIEARDLHIDILMTGREAAERETSAAWEMPESFGFAPEAVGWPEQPLAGKLPEAIESALNALVTMRDDLMAQRNEACSREEGLRKELVIERECTLNATRLKDQHKADRDQARAQLSTALSTGWDEGREAAAKVLLEETSDADMAQIIRSIPNPHSTNARVAQGDGERYRAEVDRLNKLTDKEIAEAGHPLPQMIAQRRAQLLQWTRKPPLTLVERMDLFCFKYSFDGCEMVECKHDLWEEIREALKNA